MFIRTLGDTQSMTDQFDMSAKMICFVTDPTAVTISSPRRIGRSGFADLLVEAILETSPRTKIIRIDDPPDGKEMDAASLRKTIEKGLGGKSAIIIVYPGYASMLGKATSGLISEDVALYSVQELCHQVCVCIKGLHGISACGTSRRRR